MPQNTFSLVFILIFLQRRRQILPKNINAQGFSILQLLEAKAPKGATVRDGKVAAEEILSGTSLQVLSLQSLVDR